MNIKISKEESDILLGMEIERHIVGSKMYGTSNEQSDTDILVIYRSFHNNIDLVYPNIHQFQYDDLENNTQYIFTSNTQFYRNLISGDSTINADCVMFGDFDNEYALELCRTYKIIKSFLGFAKRDIKQIRGKNKIFHVKRGLYCAEKLLDNQLPEINDIRLIDSKNGLGHLLLIKEKELRLRLNKEYESGNIKLYPMCLYKELIKSNSLTKKLVEANNIKEFKY